MKLTKTIEELNLFIMSMYAEACPMWATDGSPENILKNIKRYREDLEGKIEDLKRKVQVLESQLANAREKSFQLKKRCAYLEKKLGL